jgi:hypothetical protein
MFTLSLQYRKLTMEPKPEDKTFPINNTRGIPAGVGAVNSGGESCTVIIGHKER